MSQPDFECIVKNICHGISGNRTRNEAEEELMGHLEDTYERNIAIGKSEEEAFNASVASLGNTKLLAQQLEAVHAHSPAAQMKSAIWVFIIGFMLQRFHLDLFNGMSVITTYLGVVCILFALFLMRKVNKKLRNSFYFYALYFIFDTVRKCVVVYGVSDRIFDLICIATNYSLILFMWIFAVAGFMEMLKTYCGESEKKKPHLGFVLAYITFETIVFCGLLLLNEGENINAENVFLFIILAIVYIVIIVQLVRLKNCLWDADARYGIDSFDKKSKSVFCAVVALSIICPMCFMYGYAVKDTDKTQLVIHDTDNQTEADAIREQMLELGVDEETLAMIPDSEIMNYKDALSMTFSAQGYKDGYIDCRIFDFYFADENGGYSVRSLFVLNNSACRYRMGLYYLNFDDSFSNIEPSDEKAVYVSVLQKQGDKYYEKKPINYKFDLFENFSKVPNGFDFKAEENQTVIFAMNHKIRDARVNFTLHQGLIFVYQKVPLSFMFSTVEQTAMASGNYDFHSFSNRSDLFMESYLFMDSKIFQPEFVGQTYYTPDEVID